jgi:hypothetical protein
MKTITASLWSYDVWGNELEGYDVNDRCCLDRAIEVPDFLMANERAILEAIDASPACGIDWTMSDGSTIELFSLHTGKPLGQIVRES